MLTISVIFVVPFQVIIGTKVLYIMALRIKIKCHLILMKSIFVQFNLMHLVYLFICKYILFLELRKYIFFFFFSFFPSSIYDKSLIYNTYYPPFLINSFEYDDTYNVRNLNFTSLRKTVSFSLNFKNCAIFLIGFNYIQRNSYITHLLSFKFNLISNYYR